MFVLILYPSLGTSVWCFNFFLGFVHLTCEVPAWKNTTDSIRLTALNEQTAMCLHSDIRRMLINIWVFFIWIFLIWIFQAWMVFLVSNGSLHAPFIKIEFLLVWSLHAHLWSCFEYERYMLKRFVQLLLSINLDIFLCWCWRTYGFDTSDPEVCERYSSLTQGATVFS